MPPKSGERLRRRWFDALGVGVVGVWLFALGSLHAQAEGPGLANAQALDVDRAAGLRAGDEWQTLYMKGERVGYAHISRRRAAQGWKLAYELQLNLQVMRSNQRIHTRLNASLDDLLTLRDFEFGMDGGVGAKIGIQGTVQGHDVLLEVDTGGTKATQSITLPHKPRLSLTHRSILAEEGLAVGKSFETQFFDPSTLSERTVTIEVIGVEKIHILGKSVDAFVLRQHLEGIRLHAWVTRAGDVLKEELPLGLVAVRETEEEARFGMGFKQGGLSSATTTEAGPAKRDIITSTSAELVGALPADPRTIRRAVFELDHVPEGRFVLNEGRQRLSGKRLTVVRETVPERSPPVGDQDTRDPAVAEALASDLLIQSDHPKIVRQAKEIVGDATDGVEQVRRIMAWLGRSMTQANVVGVPSALETLRSLRGDCNEHTALFTALARSVGIPTRVDVGMAHQAGRLFYHAWAEVMLEGRWVTVDPTWGQLPADVTHLRFVRGGLGKQMAMFSVIGRVEQVQVVETTP